MVRSSKGKNRLDKFYHLAKEQGFRSRAAFKLIQLNKKYGFLNECNSVLDLCAAPGGWTQVAAKHLPVSRLIIGIDLIPIRPIRGAVSLVADITTEKCKKLIEKEAHNRLFDVVLHDGSPNVGGAWHSESLSQAILVLDALKLATQFLSPKGWFISKVFRSKDYNALMYVCNQLFNKVESTKPTASRNASAEIFLICQGYKAPAQIDPKLLDSHFLLQEYTTRSKMHGPVVMQKNQGKKMHRRFREGYEDGASTTFKSISVMTLVHATDPVETLGLYTQFTFEEQSLAETATLEEIDKVKNAFQIVDQHAKTTAEIRELCQDLLIIGKKEFKKLLKWQLAMRKALQSSRVDTESKKEEPPELNPDQIMMNEIEAIQERIRHKAKKREKKQREMKKQSRKRMAQFEQTERMVEDSIVDPDLFSLDIFTHKNQINEQHNVDDDPVFVDSDSSQHDIDSEQEDDELKYEVMLEDYLERSYQRYLKRKGDDPDLEDPTLTRRKRLDHAGELSAEEDVMDVDAIQSDAEMEADEVSVKARGGGLLVELDASKAGIATTPETISSQWYSQDIFQDADLVDDDNAQDPSPLITQPNHSTLPRATTTEETDVILEKPPQHNPDVENDEMSDLEIVEQKKCDDPPGTDTEDEFRMLDVDGKAEIIAMARKMLHRKEKESIIDAAYSRYIFHDKNLPKWFEHDNDLYNRPQRMVTRAEIEAEKEMLRAMDSRPIKKIAEAKSRKAKRLANRLRSAMKRAEGVANQEELSHRTQMRQIAKMMNTARRKENGKFVSKDQLKKMGRSKRIRVSKKLPPIDRRSKADKRVKGMGRDGKNLKQIRRKKIDTQNKRKLRKTAGN